MAFDPYLPAIKSVLAAYRSTEARITEEQIQAAWEEFSVISTEHQDLQRRKKWPPEHLVAAMGYARRLCGDGFIIEAQAHEVELALADEMERQGEQMRKERARLYVEEVRKALEGDDAAA